MTVHIDQASSSIKLTSGIPKQDDMSPATSTYYSAIGSASV